MKRSCPVDDAGVISTDLLDSRTSFEVKFFFSRIPKKYTPHKALFLPEMPSWLFLLKEVLKALFRSQMIKLLIFDNLFPPLTDSRQNP